MNIGGTRFHRVVEDRVDELDDRRHVRVGRETVEIENLFALLGFFDERDLERRCSLLQNTLRRVALSQHNVDRTRRGDIRDDADIQDVLKLVEPLEIRRVGHRRVQVVALRFEAARTGCGASGRPGSSRARRDRSAMAVRAAADRCTAADSVRRAVLPPITSGGSFSRKSATSIFGADRCVAYVFVFAHSLVLSTYVRPSGRPRSSG